MTQNPLMTRPRVIVPDRPTLTKAQKVATQKRTHAATGRPRGWHLRGKPFPGPCRWAPLTDAALFLKHVQFDTNGGCWLWAGATTGGRYGNAWSRRRRRQVLAHRQSWEVHFGAIPEGLVVCHRCDVTFCVNPAHLFLGTLRDNMQDMWRKGRGPTHRGSDVSSSKLREVQVLEIICRLIRGEHPTDIARNYGVTTEAIRMIRHGKNWRHITGGPLE